jgi:hypothetical protein
MARNSPGLHTGTARQASTIDAAIEIVDVKQARRHAIFKAEVNEPRSSVVGQFERE